MIELGLQRISRLLADTPLKWRAIHVAGTNGKGSVCAYASSMLEVYNRSPLRVDRRDKVIRHGRFTSPHLIDRWDCITVNQETVTQRFFREVEETVLERNERKAIGATQFELLTATAFEIFNKEEVDIGVVEVGLGGRLDATNIIGQRDDVNREDAEAFRPLPLVTAISSIGLDHQDVLGSTLEEIAKEKAGIIKPGVPVVYSSSNSPEVIRILRQVAKDNNCPLGTPFTKRVGKLGRFSPEWKFAIKNEFLYHRKFLQGASHRSHDYDNLMLACYAVWIALKGLRRLPSTGLGEGPWPVHPPHEISEIAKAFGHRSQEMLAFQMGRVAKTTQFPGRQQIISIEGLTGREEVVLLDGAHNAQSAKALALTVERVASSTVGSDEVPAASTNHDRIPSDGSQTRPAKDEERKAVTWVVATSSSKDAKEILSPLLKDGDAVFAVEFGSVDGMPWVKPLSASDLLEVVKTVASDPDGIHVRNCGLDVLAALKAASQHADCGPLVIAGSLYLVGDVLRLLRDAK